MNMSLYTLKVTHRMFKNYVYFIIDETSKKAGVIDPVWEMDKILEVLHQRNLTLSSILLTHSHPDHVQLADPLSRATGCPVYMSKTEIDIYGFVCSNLIPLRETEKILIGKTVITPIHTPGHTKGSVCYIAGNNIFTGDTLFIEGCGLCWGRGADPGEMYDSLQTLKMIIPPDMKVYPAHKYHTEPGITFDNVLNYNIYLDFRDKEAFIKYRMRSNQKLLFNFK